MTFLGFTGLLNFISSGILAFFVFVKCPRRDLARAYSVYNLTVAAWSLCYVFWQRATSPAQAEAVFRWLMFAVVWINQAFIYYILTFIRATERRRVVLRTVAGINLFFAFAVVRNLLFVRFEPRFGLGYWGIPTPLFTVFLIFWQAELLYGFTELALSMRKARGIERTQTLYILIALIVAYFGGNSNYPMFYGHDSYPQLNALVTVYISIVAYAIVKHQFMDMQLVIKRTLIYSIVSTSLIAIYAAIVSVLSFVLAGRVAVPSAYSSAIAAGIITLLFNPLRSAIQRVIDAHFYRTPVNREKKVMEFSNEIIEYQNLQMTTEALYRTLEGSFLPKFKRVYIRTPDGTGFCEAGDAGEQTAILPLGNNWARQFGSDSNPIVFRPTNGADIEAHQLEGWPIHVAAPVMNRGDLIGFVLLGEKRSEAAYSPEDLVLLRILANQASVAYDRPRLLRQMTSGLVHEIKMPMANIALPAQLTYRQLKEGADRGGLSGEELKPIIKRLQFIIDQAMLASRRVDALQQIASSNDRDFQVIDLRQIIETSLGAVQALAESGHVSIHREIEDCPGLHGDGEELKIVFTNLFKNAIEAMNDRPLRELRIRARMEPREIVIEVEDTGPGVPEAERELIFQSRYSTKGTKGTGMGLFLTRQVIRAHHGTVSVTTAGSGGALFMMRLPRED